MNELMCLLVANVRTSKSNVMWSRFRYRMAAFTAIYVSNGWCARGGLPAEIGVIVAQLHSPRLSLRAYYALMCTRIFADSSWK